MILGTAGGFAFSAWPDNIRAMTLTAQLITVAQVTAAAMAAVWAIYYFGGDE